MNFSNCRFHTIPPLIRGAIALAIPGIRSYSTEPFRVAVLKCHSTYFKKVSRRIMSSAFDRIRSCMASIANDVTALRQTMLLFSPVTLRKESKIYY